MYSIDLSKVIEDLHAYECMEIINKLASISGVKVYEVDHDSIVKFVLANMANKDEIIRHNKYYYESGCVNDVVQVLMSVSEGFKYSTKVFLKVYNGKVEKCDSIVTTLRDIVNEYYCGQNKTIIEKAFMKYIQFYSVKY